MNSKGDIIAIGGEVLAELQTTQLLKNILLISLTHLNQIYVFSLRQVLKVKIILIIIIRRFQN